MTPLLQEQRETVRATQELRRQLMTVLADGDLTFRPHPACLTLGELCREIGEVQRTYIDSLRTFRQDFSYRHAAEVSRSVAELSTWYAQLDRELEKVSDALTEQDLRRSVDCGHGFARPLPVQFHIYHEALLIFYAKAHVYLKALGKRVPGPWQSWIGDRADYKSVTA